MSANTNKQKCAVCSAYLFEEDDVVYCPTCGAPHHRDCYNYIGKCALESLHGTDKQYKKSEALEQDKKIENENNTIPQSNTKTCRGCMKAYPRDARFCPYCGLPSENFSPYLRENPFGKQAEIKDDTEIEEGVTALEAAKVVTVNTIRYIPKFLTLKKDKKSSWNWAAFLMPHAWLAYRKMYKQAIVAAALILISLLFSFPFSLSIAELPMPEQELKGTLELSAYYAEHLSEIGIVPTALAAFGSLLYFGTSLFSGIMGDWFYRDHTIETVKKIRVTKLDDNKASKLSGISTIGFCVALFSVDFLYKALSLFLI
ncbi:MAG: DUF2628 domain-containing protein [Clostridia bacterium]|nr:DUF2628 domain-containing protein [Clostridia bacterium]